MPLPTDKVQVDRSFRRIASDPVGTEYHTQGFMTAHGLALLRLRRGHEALEALLTLPVGGASVVMARNPIFHGLAQAVRNKNAQGDAVWALVWAYDKFGDCVFSSLKSGAYRDAGTKEWSVQEVLDDCIDEVRRVLGMEVVVDRPKPTVPDTTAGPRVGFGGRRLSL